MGYTASDLADWWDATAEEHWEKQDQFIIDFHDLGNAHTVVVFASWFGNYMGTVPARVTGGLADVLRLGNDLNFDSGLGIAKGVALNVLRLLSVAQPLTGALKKQKRHAGILALAELAKITGKPYGPCQYTALNNIVTFLKGKKVQYFADIRDIVGVGDTKARGMYIKNLLEHPKVAELITREGIKWTSLPAAKTIDEVLKAAKESSSMVRFTFAWTRPNGASAAHAVVAIKDLKNNLRIIDYTQGLTAAPGGTGYSSWAEMVAARAPTWGEGLRSATLSTNANDLPALFTSKVVQILELADRTVTLALPVAVGVKWGRDGLSFDENVPDITESALEFFQRKYGNSAPPGPADLYPPPMRPPETESVMFTHEVSGPVVKKEDWLSSISYKWYGDFLLWPILWDYNKSSEFTDPNKIKVGQRIKVPFITEKTAGELAQYKQRGRQWR